MARNTGNRNKDAAHFDGEMKRRRLLRLGTLIGALTGASAVTATNISNSYAAGDKAPPNSYVPIAEKGSPSGVASLDVDAKIYTAQLPDLSASYVSEGAAFADVSKYAGVDNTGKVECAAALQNALDSISAAGMRAYGRGTFRTATTVVFKAHADFTDAIFNYSATGTAIRVGATSGNISRTEVQLPQLVATAKTTTGWSQVAGSIGVEVNNFYTGALYVPRVSNFETGLKIQGIGQGVSYVNFHLGHLDNNKRNMLFTADSTGWANQNTIFGGRLSHNRNEGTLVPGSRHVLIESTNHKVNNNNFFGTSLESPNTVEFHLDCAGVENYWHGCRWENTGPAPRVAWRAGSTGNLIDNGFDAFRITEVREPNTANNVRSRASSRWVGYGAGGAPVLAVENPYSATAPVFRVYAAGTEANPASDKNTAWVADITGHKMLMKRGSDIYERAILDFVNGRFYVGQGTSTPTAYFGTIGNAMGFDGASIAFGTDNTHDVGIASFRPRYVRAGTAIQTGAGTTAQRPPAAIAGAGASFLDTTLGKPIWSDGNTWRDATGTVV